MLSVTIRRSLVTGARVAPAARYLSTSAIRSAAAGTGEPFDVMMVGAGYVSSHHRPLPERR